jgi:hypothetical protein
MEWLTEMVWKVLFAVLGVIVSTGVTALMRVLGKIWKEKASDETLRTIAKNCVLAVEMMYREAGGEKKLEEALLLAGEFAAKKGISLTTEEMRIYLEAALAEWKGAFQSS